MQEIKIGLIKSDPYWENILWQEGVPFEVVDGDFKNYSLLVVNTLGWQTKSKLIEYINDGGVVLSHTKIFEENHFSSKFGSFVPDDTKFFNGISLFSLNSEINPLNEQGYHNTKDLVFSKKIGKGKIILLSFELNILENVNYSPKPMFTPSGHIFQILPDVSRNSIRKLIVNCLLDLFDHAGLPYVRLSNFPSGFDGVFAFRVDADNFVENDFYETVELLSKNKIKATFFINQSSHEGKIKYIRELASKGFEIQSHMNKHCVYNSIKENYENLNQSLEFLKEFNPTAFVAPFGIFNKSLAAAEERLDMKYSSEFSYDYDNLPSFPIINGRVIKTLQIPIHPVCLESFIEVKRGDREMLEHYDYVLKKTLKERMPVFWYGHPTRVFKNYPTYFKVFSQIMKRLGKSGNIWRTTFGEYYNWWLVRLGFKYAVYFDGSNVLVKWKDPMDIGIEIYYKNKFKTSSLKNRIDLRGMKELRVDVENERHQYRKSLKDILSKLKFGLLNKYLNHKNMKQLY